MAWFHDEDLASCGPLARGLDAAGHVMLWAGALAIIAAVTGAVSAAGLLIGAGAVTAGIVTRALSCAMAGREIETRTAEVTSQRPIREAETVEPGPAVANSRELELADQENRFAAMIDGQRNARGEFGRGG